MPSTGNGNVALDVARILAKKIDELHPTDITSPSLKRLASNSRIRFVWDICGTNSKTHEFLRRVHIVGRRGPVQAAFTTAELRELVRFDAQSSSLFGRLLIFFFDRQTKLEGCQVLIAENRLTLTEADKEELKSRPKKRQFEVLQKLVGSEIHRYLQSSLLTVVLAPDQPVDPNKFHIILHFLKSPVEFTTTPESRCVVVFETTTLSGRAGSQSATGTGNRESLPCGIVFKSIGYKSKSIQAVPFDARRGIIPNMQGRVMNITQPVLGLYVAGWLKRGPSGIVGTNKNCAEETVRAVAADVESGMLPATHEKVDFVDFLRSRGHTAVTFDQWKNLDAFEVSAGAALGKAREKVLSIAQMLDISRGRDESLHQDVS